MLPVCVWIRLHEVEHNDSARSAIAVGIQWRITTDPAHAAALFSESGTLRVLRVP